VIVEQLEEIPARSVHQQDERRGALRKEILRFAVCRDAKVNQLSYSQIWSFREKKRPLPVQVQRGGFRIQRIEHGLSSCMRIIEKSSVQNVLWAEVVLQTQEVVAGHWVEVLASSGNSRTSVNVCCKLIASENQKRRARWALKK